MSPYREDELKAMSHPYYNFQKLYIEYPLEMLLKLPIKEIPLDVLWKNLEMFSFVTLDKYPEGFDYKKDLQLREMGYDMDYRYVVEYQEPNPVSWEKVTEHICKHLSLS